jgi:hypothetical protein
MKIEFLAEGADACPLIRLFDFQTSEVKDLRTACRQLASGRIAEFALHEQPWIESVEGCRLLWRAGPKDKGIALPQAGSVFVLEYSSEGWRDVSGLLRPFLGDIDGFNWLTDRGDVELLISRDGKW